MFSGAVKISTYPTRSGVIRRCRYRLCLLSFRYTVSIDFSEFPTKYHSKKEGSFGNKTAVRTFVGMMRAAYLSSCDFAAAHLSLWQARRVFLKSGWLSLESSLPANLSQISTFSGSPVRDFFWRSAAIAHRGGFARFGRG